MGDSLGIRIKARRKKVGLRLADVAASIGSNVSTLSRIENDLHSPTFEQVELIAGVLRCSLAALVPVRRVPRRSTRQPSDGSR